MTLLLLLLLSSSLKTNKKCSHFRYLFDIKSMICELGMKTLHSRSIMHSSITWMIIDSNFKGPFDLGIKQVQHVLNQNTMRFPFISFSLKSELRNRFANETLNAFDDRDFSMRFFIRTISQQLGQSSISCAENTFFFFSHCFSFFQTFLFVVNVNETDKERKDQQRRKNISHLQQ